MMRRYDKYKVTVESRLEGNADKMTLFVPWSTLEDEVALYLDNCMTVTIDGGIREEKEED